MSAGSKYSLTPENRITLGARSPNEDVKRKHFFQASQ